MRGVTSGAFRTRIFESLNVLYVGRGKDWRMKSLKFESLRVSSPKVGASLVIESLNGNPAWKFEAAATRSKVKDRWKTSSGQARVRKFESLEFESWKPREFQRLQVRKVQSLKVRKVSIFGG